jgi:AcrR family transcriptional regulator
MIKSENKKQPEKRIAEHSRIIDFTREKFLKEGFYKTSMDTVAAQLQMSKKTIYKHFATKEKLVESIVEDVMMNIGTQVDEIIKSKLDALEKTITLMKLFGSQLIKFSDNWLRDIQIQMPALWEKIDGFRTKKMYGVLSSIIEQGKKEEYFIDKPNELIITIFVSSIRSIVSPGFLYYHKFNYQEAFHHTFEILFNGILTSKGKKKFNKTFSKVFQ